jgi:hypothetical protein
MKEKDLATVVLFEDRAVFLTHRQAVAGLGIAATPADDGTMLLLSCPFWAAEKAGVDLNSAVDEWGTSGSRTSRNATLANPPEFLDESFLRAADLSRLAIDKKKFAVFGFTDSYETQRLIGSLTRLGGIQVWLSGTNTADLSTQPDFVFIAHSALRESLTAPRLMQWLGSGTRFFEFDLLGLGCRFLSEIWPREKGLVCFTYEAFIKAGFEGVGRVMKVLIQVGLGECRRFVLTIQR